jgi:hypothetical protein
MDQTASGTTRIADLLGQVLDRAARDPEQIKLLQQLALAILETYPTDNTPPGREEPDTEPAGASDEEIDTLLEAFARKPEADTQPEAHSQAEAEPDLAEPIRPLQLPERLRLKAHASRPSCGLSGCRRSPKRNLPRSRRSPS